MYFIIKIYSSKAEIHRVYVLNINTVQITFRTEQYHQN